MFADTYVAVHLYEVGIPTSDREASLLRAASRKTGMRMEHPDFLCAYLPRTWPCTASSFKRERGRIVSTRGGACAAATAGMLWLPESAYVVGSGSRQAEIDYIGDLHSGGKAIRTAGCQRQLRARRGFAQKPCQPLVACGCNPAGRQLQTGRVTEPRDGSPEPPKQLSPLGPYQAVLSCRRAAVS